MIRLRGILRASLYVRITPNRFDVRHIESGREASEVVAIPFTTRRILVGKYDFALQALHAGMKAVGFAHKHLSAPKVCVHPLPMFEGAPSQDRVDRQP
jgi:hypothetical protein